MEISKKKGKKIYRILIFSRTPLLNAERVVWVVGPNFEPPGFGATFYAKKMLFLAIFTHFLCAKFNKNSLVIQKWQYLPPLKILEKLVQQKLQKMAKNSPKTVIFGYFCMLGSIKLLEVVNIDIL